MDRIKMALSTMTLLPWPQLAKASPAHTSTPMLTITVQWLGLPEDFISPLAPLLLLFSPCSTIFTHRLGHTEKI